MKKVKTIQVEGLFNAYKNWHESFEKTFTDTEESREKWKSVIEKQKELEGTINTDNVGGYAEYCLVTAFTDAIVFAKLSLSRLLKCLEVCGFEVV